MHPADRIDLTCDDFESLWRRGQRPRIEDLIEVFPAETREALLYELMSIEFELTLKEGGSLYLDEWLLRFPEYHLTIFRVFQSFLWEGSLDSPICLSSAPDELRLKQFRLVAVIGHGGFGTVWLAEDTLLSRQVAIKTPHVNDGDSLQPGQSVLREAVAAANLRHPHIVPVYEVGDEKGRWFLVTAYIPGGNLKQLLKTGGFSTGEAAQLSLKLAQGLDCAHEAGVLHRDLKPSNILISGTGEPLIADFGLARSRIVEDVANGICGTRAYMAPEQIAGLSGDERTDIFSMGLIIGELARTADLDLSSSNVHPILEGVSDRKSNRRGLTARVLERISEKCCQVEADDRYASAAELASDLQRLIAGRPTRQAEVPWRDNLRIRIRSHWKLISAAIVCLAAICTVPLLSGVTPPPNTRPVWIETEPSGCEITVVPIDDMTGEPDPTRIQNASDTTPVEMHLPPGDYLIVAVLDDQRFHEVFRHVPTVGEPAPLPASHRRWALQEETVQVPTITIPPAAIVDRLVAVEPTESVSVRTPMTQSGFESLNVPGFLAEPRATKQLLSVSTPPASGESLTETSSPRSPSFHDAMKVAEAAGLRLPSAAEVALLQSLSLTGRLTEVKDLRHEFWEWTTSQPGSPASGGMPPIARNSFSGAKLLIGTNSQMTRTSSGETALQLRIQVHDERHHADKVGFRAIRSRRPRRTPADFVNRITSIDAPTADSEKRSELLPLRP